jgi:hypothetical protein
MFQRGEETGYYTATEIADYPYLIRLARTLIRLVIRELKGLMPCCNVNYDDGDVAVFDLNAPAGPLRSGGAAPG